MKEKFITDTKPDQLLLRRYRPSDLFKALVGRLQQTQRALTFGTGKSLRWKNINYVENEQYILFKFSTDCTGDKFFSSIAEVLATYPESTPEKLMIFPIAEKNYNRKHWVTVVFEPQTLEACIIDSRPSYISFFYPTDPIKKMLGATSLSHVYQSVQHNNIYCGTWTGANISTIIELGLNNIPDIITVMNEIFCSEQEESLYLEYPTTREIKYIEELSLEDSRSIPASTAGPSQSGLGFFSLVSNFFSGDKELQKSKDIPKPGC